METRIEAENFLNKQYSRIMRQIVLKFLDNLLNDLFFKGIMSKIRFR